MDLFKVYFEVATGEVRLNELELTIIIFHTFTLFYIFTSVYRFKKKNV